MSKQALILIDFINEIVDPSGKLAAKGYAEFIEHNSTFQSLNDLIGSFESSGDLIVNVRLGFDVAWVEQPKTSPIFGKANEFGILQRDTWSTETNQSVALPADALEVTKRRVSAFYGTFLEQTLRNLGVQSVVLAGVATDLAVESAARDAHDRDFAVEVASAACAAANSEDHDRALTSMAKFAQVR